MPTHSRAARAGLVLCAAAISASASSCSSQAAPPRRQTPPISTNSLRYPTVLDSATLHLPVQDYMLTEEQLRTIAIARVTMVNGCLHRFKIKVSTPLMPTGPNLYGPISLTDRRYGITDPVLATKFGFGLGPRDPRLQIKPAQPTLGPDGQTALTGQGRSKLGGQIVPDGGCLAEADRRLDSHKLQGVDPELPQRLQFQSFEWSRNDPKVRTAFQAWSNCMLHHRYHYNDPLAASADPQFTGSTSVSKQAIAVALTDISCKRRTNLVGIWFGVESDYQKRQIQTHANAFERAKAALDARVTVARAAIS